MTSRPEARYAWTWLGIGAWLVIVAAQQALWVVWPVSFPDPSRLFLLFVSGLPLGVATYLLVASGWRAPWHLPTVLTAGTVTMVVGLLVSPYGTGTAGRNLVIDGGVLVLLTLVAMVLRHYERKGRG